MNRKELLKQAKLTVDALVRAQKEEAKDTEDDAEATKLALLLESNQSIVEAIQEKSVNDVSFLQSMVDAIRGIKIDVPETKVPEVKVTIPDIKLPEFPPFAPFPEIKLPEIKVPEPKVTVNVPEIKLPTINIPETVVNFPSKMDVGLDSFTMKNPLPVIQVDPAGNFIAPTTAGGGASRRVKIDNNASEPIPISGTISATFSADFGSGEVGSQTLRIVQATDAISSVNIVGGSISTTPGATFYASDAVGSVNVIQAIPFDVQQISGHNWSTYLTGANGTIGVVTINPDGLPVYGGTSSGGGLTDTELRASAVPVTQVSGASWSTQSSMYVLGAEVSTTNPLAIQPPAIGYLQVNHAATLGVNQLSGANWSVSVTDVYGTTATNLVNPDGRLKVELPTGSSGLTDTELRATSLTVNQLSGANWSVSVIDIFGSTATSMLNGDNRLRVAVDTGSSGLTDSELRASHIDVQQLSGAIDSVYITGASGTVATSMVDSSGIAYGGANPVPISIIAGGATISAVAGGLNMNLAGVAGFNTPTGLNETTNGVLRVVQMTDSISSVSATQAGTWNVATVTSITNTIAAMNVDSTGVGYSGSNPLPTKEVRASTGTNTSVADNAASTTILASNTARLGATVYNDSSATLYLLLGATAASTTNYTCRVASMGYYEVPFGYTGQLTGIWATDPGDGAARVTEIT